MINCREKILRRTHQMRERETDLNNLSYLSLFFSFFSLLLLEIFVLLVDSLVFL